MTITNVASIATLRTLGGSGSATVLVEGYASPGDGGGGVFYFDANDTSTADDGGTIIVGTGGARFYRIYDQLHLNYFLSPLDRNGSTDNSVAFSNALNVATHQKAELILGPGPILISNASNVVSLNTVTLTGSATDDSNDLTGGKGTTFLEGVMYFPAA